MDELAATLVVQVTWKLKVPAAPACTFVIVRLVGGGAVLLLPLTTPEHPDRPKPRMDTRIRRADTYGSWFAALFFKRTLVDDIWVFPPRQFSMSCRI